MFPLLGVDPKMFKCDIKVPGLGYIGSRYVNTYLWNVNAKTPDYTLSVVHRNINDTRFQAFEDTLESLANFVESYDILDTNYGVKVFELPSLFRREYDLFLDGSYSRFSRDAKEIVLQEAPLSSVFSTKINDIFTKNPNLKAYQEGRMGVTITPDMELWSRPNMVLETLNNQSLETLRDGITKYNRKIAVAT